MNDFNLLDFNEQLAVERVWDQSKYMKTIGISSTISLLSPQTRQCTFLKNQDCGKLKEHSSTSDFKRS